MISMLAAIRNILLFVGIGLALLLLLVIVGLSLRTGVEAVGMNGQLTVDLRWGFLRIPFYPPLGKKKRRSNAQKGEKARAKGKKRPKTKRKAKTRYTLNREKLDIGELLGLLLRLLDELTDTLRISSLKVRVLIGTPDAAQTGMLLGSASAMVGLLVPFFENTFAIQDYAISIDADFDARHTEWAGKVFCSLRPIHLFVIVLRHGKELYRLYKNLIQKEETVSNE